MTDGLSSVLEQRTQKVAEQLKEVSDQLRVVIEKIRADMQQRSGK